MGELQEKHNEPLYTFHRDSGVVFSFVCVQCVVYLRRYTPKCIHKTHKWVCMYAYTETVCVYIIFSRLVFLNDLSRHYVICRISK